MNLELNSFPMGLAARQAAQKLVACNEITEAYGLTLTEQEATELAETRSLSLQNSGRIEFGGGIIQKLIEAFCSSPYLNQRNYAQTLHELVELFYYFKNETYDAVSDDRLIRLMRKAYDGGCHGATEILGSMTWEELKGPAPKTAPEDEEDEFA